MTKRVLILQLDGKLPNIACMRIGAHHRATGDEIHFYHAHDPQPLVFEELQPDLVYASAIFSRNRDRMEKLLAIRPDAIVGGTVFDTVDDDGNYIADQRKLQDHGITTKVQDYSLYPWFKRSIGFTQRGCTLNCYFCGVRQKEGPVHHEQDVHGLWRGLPYPKELHLLDNDFFGQPEWPEIIREIREGGFRVCFNQGINARFLTEDTARAIASVEYYDDGFRFRRIYTAWDSIGSEQKLFEGLRLLVDAGVARSHLFVYMLIGGRGDTHEDRDYRRRKLREFGALPYPMPYLTGPDDPRRPELSGFARWVVTHADKSIPWDDWVRSGYQIRRAKRLSHSRSLFEAD